MLNEGDRFMPAKDVDDVVAVGSAVTVRMRQAKPAVGPNCFCSRAPRPETTLEAERYRSTLRIMRSSTISDNVLGPRGLLGLGE